MIHTKQKKRTLRHRRVRARVAGTARRPRAAVYRSLKHIHVQFIDDEHGRTLLALSDRALGEADGEGTTKTERAFQVGKRAGAEALSRGIKAVVFDRGGFRYHGRVKAVADGLREAGVNV